MPRGHYKPFSAREYAVIQRLWHTGRTPAVIAVTVGRTAEQIRNLAQYRGWPTHRQIVERLAGGLPPLEFRQATPRAVAPISIVISDEVKARLLKAYSSGARISDLALRFGMSQADVLRFASDAGLKLRLGGKFYYSETPDAS